jgi:two-component system, chemotaxis family, chemotaxis protein CheY
MARIAIVDDSRLARTFAASCLKKEGHEPIDVDPTSIFDVLTALKQTNPDVILTDYLMPHCPGMSLVRSCREDATLNKAKIIVITAHHDDDVQERLSRLGANAFLHKPFEPQALLDAIKELLS